MKNIKKKILLSLLTISISSIKPNTPLKVLKYGIKGYLTLLAYNQLYFIFNVCNGWDNYCIFCQEIGKGILTGTMSIEDIKNIMDSKMNDYFEEQLKKNGYIPYKIIIKIQEEENKK